MSPSAADYDARTGWYKAMALLPTVVTASPGDRCSLRMVSHLQKCSRSWKGTCQMLAVSQCQSPLEAPGYAYWRERPEPHSGGSPIRRRRARPLMTFPAFADQGVERLGGRLQRRGDLLRRSPRLLQGRQGGSIFFCSVRPDSRPPLCPIPSIQCSLPL